MVYGIVICIIMIFINMKVLFVFSFYYNGDVIFIFVVVKNVEVVIVLELLNGWNNYYSIIGVFIVSFYCFCYLDNEDWFVVRYINWMVCSFNFYYRFG